MRKVRNSIVADVMKTPVVTSGPEEDISRIASTMRNHKIGSIVITDNQRIVGILTKSDFVKIVEQVGMLLKEDLAKHFMARPVVTVQSDASVSEAVRLMRTNHIRHLVVLDKGLKMVGMLSFRDLMSAAREAMET
ncbi:MAG TPA: CBS domain-containing protein [Terriglobales bacterium]|nr:CBS domain-containing protein [Terriglobales bacterium]